MKFLFGFSEGLGDNIKKIREQKGLLQKQLAAEVNIPYTSYNKVENNNTRRFKRLA